MRCRVANQTARSIVLIAKPLRRKLVEDRAQRRIVNTIDPRNGSRKCIRQQEVGAISFGDEKPIQRSPERAQLERDEQPRERKLQLFLSPILTVDYGIAGEHYRCPAGWRLDVARVHRRKPLQRSARSIVQQDDMLLLGEIVLESLAGGVLVCLSKELERRGARSGVERRNIARAATRERESRFEPPWGESFSDLRQLLLETSVLALLGGAAGLLLAWWGVDLLRAACPADLPRLEEIRVNGLVVAFTFGIACLTSLIFGLIPALQASRPQVEQALKEAARGSTGGARSHRLRSAFVVSQFALSLVLLVGAGLLIRSFAQLRAVQPGFEANGVVTFWQTLPKARYGEVDQQTQFFDKLLAKLTTLPGIEKVGLVSPLPFSGNEQGRTFTIVGHPAPAEGMEPAASLLTTDGAYFRTMRIPLKRGRLFDARDGKDAKPVVLINDTFARKISLTKTRSASRCRSASAKTARRGRSWASSARRNMATWRKQMKRNTTFRLPRPPTATATSWCARASRRPPAGDDDSPRSARDRCTAIHPDAQAVAGTGERDPLAIALQHRFAGRFAAVAILLAAVGIYGVIAYNVTQRTKKSEFAWRLARSAGKC